MSVYFVTGNLGGGKSLMSVHRIKEYLERGRPVATNLDISLHHMFHPHAKKIKLYRIPDKPCLADLELIGMGNESYDEEKNGLLVFDECGTWFNSRSWGDKERQPLINWLLHARKLGWDVIFIIQHISIVDKQARLALGEHVVYCKRTDRMNIPVIGTIFKIFMGGRLPIPRIHVGIVKYGLLPTALTVDNWCAYGSKLFRAYDTKQVFSELYSHGVHTMLPPYYYKGRYALKKDWSFVMRMTKIYFKRYSRVAMYVFGVVSFFMISEAIAYKNRPPVVAHEVAIDQNLDSGTIEKIIAVQKETDTDSLPEEVIEETVKTKLNYVQIFREKSSYFKILYGGGVYTVSTFPYPVDIQDGVLYADLPVSDLSAFSSE